MRVLSGKTTCLNSGKMYQLLIIAILSAQVIIAGCKTYNDSSRSFYRISSQKALELNKTEAAIFGKVFYKYESQKYPAVGARITISGIDNIVTTDKTGQFSLDLESGHYILKLEYSGYQPFQTKLFDLETGKQREMTICFRDSDLTIGKQYRRNIK
jgi:hypothetical protein